MKSHSWKLIVSRLVKGAPLVGLFAALIWSVAYAPPAIAVTVPWHGAITRTLTRTLTLNNTGAASSMYTITEQAGGFNPMKPEAMTFLIVGSASSNVTASRPL